MNFKHIVATDDDDDIAYVGNNHIDDHWFDWVEDIEDAYIFDTKKELERNITRSNLNDAYYASLVVIYVNIPDIDLLVSL